MIHLMDMPVSLATIRQLIAVKVHSKLDSATVLAVEIAVNIICHNCGISSNGDPAGIGCLNKIQCISLDDNYPFQFFFNVSSDIG